MSRHSLNKNNVTWEMVVYMMFIPIFGNLCLILFVL